MTPSRSTSSCASSIDRRLAPHHHAARRDLRRLDSPVRRRVVDALNRLVGDPPAGDIIKLQGEDEHRLRVGDWRVLLRLAPDEPTVYVLRVLPRGRAYER